MSEREGITIGEATREAASVLRRAGVAEARREAASLLAHAIERDRTFLITHAEERLARESAMTFHDYVERRAAGEPLQYITGRQEFFSLDFEVTPDVLIPRPETELLVETALRLLDEGQAGEGLAKEALVCDVGTGSGCIPVAVLHERGNVRAVGLDISPAALSVAARNAARHDVLERLSLIASDCFDALDERHARFDLIVSNPPYVAAAALEGLQREVRDHEPRVALTPGPDGLTIIRRLLTDSTRFLKRGGHLLIEIGYDQHEAVHQLIDTQAWQLQNIHKDLQGIPRTVALRKR
ncbi:MAG TPA: peptide chain release factor N(5)-glutamine methyltransferase [Pyrinomonadaceae bacterium]|nr:peptide chain release factor N(5)-glutamine methyltransferase [Pyrinomonadaceae bacterium]